MPCGRPEYLMTDEERAEHGLAPMRLTPEEPLPPVSKPELVPVGEDECDERDSCC